MATPKILVVDDEKNIRRSVEMICSGEGYGVRTAESADEAQKIMSGEPVDLILLDIMMPGTDGLTFLKKIKSENNDLSVIMISGNAHTAKCGRGDQRRRI